MCACLAVGLAETDVTACNTAFALTSQFSSVERESNRLSFDFLLKFARLLAFRRVNISRVIYLDQHAVVAACECMRPSKYKGREVERELRHEIEGCVDEDLAIFPYSEVHLSEAANVTDPESRAEQIRFWKRASKGYRFHDARAIETIQLQTVLKERPIRFARELAVHHSMLSFEQELPDRDPRGQKRGESFR